MNSPKKHLSTFRVSALLVFLLFFLAGFVSELVSQSSAEMTGRYPSFLSVMKWRCIGPHRGGRVTAVEGHPTDSMTYYMGATGGGVWKTADGGTTWINISDGFFKTGSVGGIDVADSDPNIIYVGMGESPIRGDVSHGDGVYKSTDGGKTWKNIGLKNTRQIARVRIHPKNPDLVYIAALGHVWGPNPERGVYRTKDGGETWDKVLFRTEQAGCVDLSMDPNNSRILYAAFWEARRYPWGLHTSGPDSSIYKTTDGGDTWVELTKNPGLPRGLMDRIGIAVSPAKPDRVWVIIRAENEHGVYRSDDGGATWARISDNPVLFVRPFYYQHIHADTQDPETVYVLNTGFWKSTDGGRTYVNIRTPHGDHHDLWMDPQNNRRMINGNDGGATVSFNGGETWSTIYNQPTAQMYHVATDNQFPYRVYGGQQDNGTISIPSRSRSGAINSTEWYSVGGSEDAYIAVHPKDPNIVFATDHYWLTRYDHRTRQKKFISPWNELYVGWGAKDLKYRFQWMNPVLISPHDPEVLYICAEVVFRSKDRGHSWEIISPDLTRADPTTMEVTPLMGREVPEYQAKYWGPVYRENSAIEWYPNIFAFAESPLEEGLLWAGSADGLIHISRDGGRNWENVTIKDLPEFTLISIIDPSPHDPGTAYVAATRYKLDDYRPYLYKTHDYGKTWKRITRGILSDDFTRVIREDPSREGLLYAGTETGVYVSFDDGESWQPLQLNLPAVPVRDLVVKDKDLVAATHGRSFWILDNLTLLHQLDDESLDPTVHLFKPKNAIRFRRGGGVGSPVPSANAPNPPNGAMIYYYIKEIPKRGFTLTIMDATGGIVREYYGVKKSKNQGLDIRNLPRITGGKGGGQHGVENILQGTDIYAEASLKNKTGGAPLDMDNIIQAKPGINLFVWDLRYPGPTKVPGSVWRMGTPSGPLAVPGTYRVQLTVGEDTLTEELEVLKDPLLNITQEEFEEQFEFLMRVRDKLSETHDAVNALRSIRQQLWQTVKATESMPTESKIKSAAKAIEEKLLLIEDKLIQFRAKARRDLLSYPVMLSNKINGLAKLVESADGRPTEQDYKVLEDHILRLKEPVSQLRNVIETDVAAFNQMVQELNIPRVILHELMLKE